MIMHQLHALAQVEAMGVFALDAAVQLQGAAAGLLGALFQVLEQGLAAAAAAGVRRLIPGLKVRLPAAA